VDTTSCGRGPRSTARCLDEDGRSKQDRAASSPTRGRPRPCNIAQESPAPNESDDMLKRRCSGGEEESQPRIAHARQPEAIGNEEGLRRIVPLPRALPSTMSMKRGKDEAGTSAAFVDPHGKPPDARAS